MGRSTAINSRARILGTFDHSLDERGATIVESAIAFPFFLLILLSTIDLLRVIQFDISLHYTLANAARWGIIGERLDDPAAPGFPLSREESIEQRLQATAQSYGISLSADEIRLCPSTDPHCLTDFAGNPNDFFLISVSRPISLFAFGGKTIAINATVISKNEPF
jgi:hypothetical protein